MSFRGYHVYSARSQDGTFSILLEITQLDTYLILRNGSCAEVDRSRGASLKQSFTKVLSGYGFGGILKVSEDDAFLIVVTGVLSVGNLLSSDVFRVTQVEFVPLAYEMPLALDTRLTEVYRLLSSGSFYFSYDSSNSSSFDLSSSRQHSTPNDSFIWNSHLTLLLEKFNVDTKIWILRLICGSVLIRTIYVAHLTAKVAIISRLSWERVGTRFNIRGVNDGGHVANFVETEQIIAYDDKESSFVQCRGSVPLFWEQPGINVGSHKVNIKCLERHYHIINTKYGEVATVNLLGHKEGEKSLSRAYQEIFKKSSYSTLPFFCFDYHGEMKTSKGSATQFVEHIINSTKPDFYFKGAEKRMDQSRVFRTNCLDCLDRTNCVQTLIGLQVAKQQLDVMAVDQVKAGTRSRFEEVLKEIWQKNGDLCSVIYTGTGSLDGKSKLKDASRSIARTIQGNVMDASKQEAFDLFLLGHRLGNSTFDKLANLLPYSFLAHDCLFSTDLEMASEMVNRRSEYTTTSSLTVFAGSWNVNGGKNMYNVAFKHEQNLLSWLFPSNTHQSYDIIAIGLEEIVDLNASNMVKAGTTNQRVWLSGVKDMLKEHTNIDYVVLACEQLVGVCCMVFARPTLVHRLRQLDVDQVKTGAGGTMGNKGSVSVRFVLDSTSFCFVASHFAAGQNEVKERNEDFKTASRKIRFEKGRTMPMHDVVTWFGDFNYRINLPGEDVKSAVRDARFAELVCHDQLTTQRQEGNVFEGFQEGELNFAPTYKAPAWTDRILYKSDSDVKIDLIQWVDDGIPSLDFSYGRSELKTSDHRPVAAIYEVTVLNIVPNKVEHVVTDILKSVATIDCRVHCSVNSGEVPTEKILNLLEMELAILPLHYKVSSNVLTLHLQSPAEAIAALSMDGLSVGSQSVHMHLGDNSWASRYIAKLNRHLEEQEQRNSIIAQTFSCHTTTLNLVEDPVEITSIQQPPMRPPAPVRMT